VEALGVGTAPIPQKQLTAEKLAAAIRTAATDQGMRQRAAALGQQLQAEDGVGNALKVIQSVGKASSETEHKTPDYA
jgi:UDP:flavonoid glycosyltransferase YjiC (YdhE family)